jgi:two-component system, chemotaxis family, protein-glutamate methylesterase/glutaminase
MNKIRVMLVDDAVVVRRMVTDVLASDPVIEVAGTASNGNVALSRLDQFNPDLVVMDVEMPDMDGLTALKEMRKRRPTMPVIMFSTLTERGAVVTLDALALGANDYVHKPANVGSVAEAQERIREELIPKIKALSGIKKGDRVFAQEMRSSLKQQGYLPRSVIFPSPQTAPSKGENLRKSAQRALVEMVVIGVSTGGPNALNEVLGKIPKDLPVPILIVQHMPAMFTRLLAQRLSTTSGLSVREAAGGESPKAGEVWLAPGDYHLLIHRELGRSFLELNQKPPENSCRPAVDCLFRSAASAYGPGVLGVVLTGMGKDGLLGSRAIKSNGGQIVVQDEATSVVWGMPGFVSAEGLADKELALPEIPLEIIKRVQTGRVSNRSVDIKQTAFIQSKP